MKKLLLVMLVPVMVLGMLGCGALETGNETPEQLQGLWTTTAAAPFLGATLVLTANEMSVFNNPSQILASVILAFRTEYGGPVYADLVAGEEFTLKLIRIYDSVELGTIKATYTGANAFSIDEFEPGSVPYYELSRMLMADPLGPTAQNYTRS